MKLVVAKIFGRVGAAMVAAKAEKLEPPEAGDKGAEGGKTTEPEVPLSETEGESHGVQASPEILAPENTSGEGTPEGKSAKDKPKKAEKLTPEQETNRHFFSALLLGTVVEKDAAVFDAWVAQRASVGLILNCGCVLLLACFYPGDGLRIYECCGGILLVLMGLHQVKDLSRIRVEALGSALGQFISAHSVEENLEILQAVNPVLPIVMKHINPTASEKEPAQIVKEIAEKSKYKPVTNQNWQNPHRKKKKR
jgi:hypothetical protein